jgi:hypothetical protein
MAEGKADAVEQSAGAKSAPKMPVRPEYQSPELLYLGSVREVTRGATGPKNDFQGGRKQH